MRKVLWFVKSFGFEGFLGVTTQLGKVKCFLYNFTIAFEENSGEIPLVFLSKETKRKSASLEPLIGLLALLVGKLWDKKHKLINP